jgi:two-component system, NarL family, sensor histidine kinase FusK
MTAPPFISDEITSESVLRRYGKSLSQIALVCIAYFVAARLGLAVPFTSGNVSPVWPAAGIALASVLLFGYRVWPGIALGAFLANLFSPIPHIAAAGLAFGNTVAALAGAFMLRRLPSFNTSLSRLIDVLQLIALGALVSPLVSATVGVATLFAAHVQAWQALPMAWVIYWLGDAMGVLLITPLLLTLSSIYAIRRERIAEVATLILLLALTCFVIFNDRLLGELKHDVLAFGVFPFVIWAATRFGMIGSSFALLVIATIATVETALGSGPFAQSSPFQNSALLQVYLAVLAVSGLTLAAVVAEREQTEAERTKLIHDQAHQAVLLRDLSGRLLQMQDEERRRIARELHDSAGQTITAIGLNLSVVAASHNLSPEASKAIADTVALGEELSREIRTMSYLLHPPLLDEAGLESALQWYVSGFGERSKIKVSLQLPPELPRLSSELEISIFRIVQESLTNVYRHSGSPTASVSIRSEREVLRLCIEDAGKGIAARSQPSVPSVSETGVGLRGMQERVAQLGGTLQIESSETGTRVIARFSMSKREHDAAPA